MGGMRGVGFAALLGLDDFRKDAFATGMPRIPDSEKVSARRNCLLLPASASDDQQ